MRQIRCILNEVSEDMQGVKVLRLARQGRYDDSGWLMTCIWNYVGSKLERASRIDLGCDPASDFAGEWSD